MKNGGWLSKYNTPEAQNGIEGTMAGLTDKGFNYNGAWGGTMAMGGSLPGSVGFTYARTQDPAPSNGKYAKKTKASAQNGQEMKFYQEGLDWKPKNISKNGGWLSKYEDGGIIEDDRGQWEYPGEITKINSNQITMQGVDYPVLGISDTGDMQMMQPGQDYTYKGKSVTEVPMMEDGGEKTKAKPDSLLNLRDFTITPDELTYLNDPRNGYCVNTGNCLESTRKAYDMTAGRIKGIPDSNSILTKDLGLTSTRTKPTEKQIQEYPYFAGDKNYGSSDSWDEQGVIIKAGGKNIFSGAKNQMVPKDIPVGAIAGWGPSGTRETTYADRKQGMNTKYGLQPSHHSTESMGY
jgi:hypothetical protein